MGILVGILVGFAVGFAVGFLVGFAVGFLVGFAVGFAVGVEETVDKQATNNNRIRTLIIHDGREPGRRLTIFLLGCGLGGTVRGRPGRSSSGTEVVLLVQRTAASRVFPFQVLRKIPLSFLSRLIRYRQLPAKPSPRRSQQLKQLGSPSCDLHPRLHTEREGIFRHSADRKRSSLAPTWTLTRSPTPKDILRRWQSAEPD